MVSPLTRPPAWLRPLLPGAEWQGAPTSPGGRPRLYLTFDDGPIPEETPWVLAQLAAYGARATFFCVGDNLRRYPALAQDIRAVGHRLGNHTQHHQSAWQVPRAEYLAGVVAGAASLAAALHLPAAAPGAGRGGGGVPMPPVVVSQVLPAPLFRPPHGRLTWPVLRALRAQGYRVVMWSVLTRDYDRDLPPETALRLTLAATRPGDILVLHDSRKASASLRYLLPRLLAHYAALGYEFAAL